jgi:trigger factor
MKDDALRDSFVGKAAGDEVTVDPHKVSEDHEDLARMLNTTMIGCTRIGGQGAVPHRGDQAHGPGTELDQELFDRVYGKDAVAMRLGFRAKVKEGLENMFRRDSDRMFKRLVMKKLQERTSSVRIAGHLPETLDPGDQQNP